METEYDIQHSLAKKRNRHKVFFHTKQIAANYDRRTFLTASLRELVFYIVYLIVLQDYVSYIKNRQVFDMQETVRDFIVTAKFDSEDRFASVYDGIEDPSGLWQFLEDVIPDLLYNKFFYDRYDPVVVVKEREKDIIFFSSTMIGRPRLRQLKVKNNSCVIHPAMQWSFETCYGYFSPAAEDKEPFGLKTDGWTYSEPDKTTVTLKGIISSYYGGGFMVDLPADYDGYVETLNKLKRNIWIDRGTRLVLLEFVLLNLNTQILCNYRLMFEINPAGRVYPRVDFLGIELTRYLLEDDLFSPRIALRTMFILIFLAQFIIELMYFKTQYFLKPWTYVELGILILYPTALFIRAYMVPTQIRSRLQQLTDKNFDGHLRLDTLFYYEERVFMLFGCLIFISVLKIFKYLDINGTMAIILNTIHKTVKDLMGLMVMFTVMMINFAEVGSLLFGENVPKFMTTTNAWLSLQRVIMTDFNTKALKFSGQGFLITLYVVVLIFSICFVILNLYVALLATFYSEAKLEADVAPESLGVIAYLQELLEKYCKFLPKRKKVQYADKDRELVQQYLKDIYNILKHTGFNNLEIMSMFSRFQIDTYHENLSRAKVTEFLKELTETAGVTNADEENLRQKLESNKAGTHKAELHKFEKNVEDLQEIESTLEQLIRKINYLLNGLDIVSHVMRKQRPKKDYSEP